MASDNLVEPLVVLPAMDSVAALAGRSLAAALAVSGIYGAVLACAEALGHAGFVLLVLFVAHWRLAFGCIAESSQHGGAANKITLVTLSPPVFPGSADLRIFAVQALCQGSRPQPKPKCSSGRPQA